jgi:hypothetical protein
LDLFLRLSSANSYKTEGKEKKINSGLFHL